MIHTTASTRQRSLNSRPTRGGHPTLSDVLDFYAGSLKETIAARRGMIAINHLKKIMGDLPINLVSSSIPSYITFRGVSAGTINRELGVLRTALVSAYRTGMIDHLPSIHKLPSPPPRARYLNEAEVMLLLDAAKEYPEMETFVRIALMTGQRKEAILTLRWDQVDLNANLIDFNDRTAPLHHRMKGRGVIPLSSALRRLLVALKRVSKATLVVEKDGKAIKSFRFKWARIVKEAGLDITPHVLRHTVATQLAQKNVPMTQIARILGHSNTQITERVYSKFSPSFCRDAVEHLAV